LGVTPCVRITPPSDLQLIIRNVRKLAAIVQLRKSRGISLQQAMELIERQEEGALAVDPAHGAGSELPALVREAMDRGQKIEAIRLLREQTGLGLKQANDAVGAYADAAPASVPVVPPATATATALAPGEVPPSGSAARLWVWVALAIAGVLLYRLWAGSGA
jgi:ribosomal protein L7/L12